MDLVKRPDTKNDSADDLLRRDTADLAQAGIHRALPLISHYKIVLIRNLIRQLQIALAKAELFNIRLIELYSIDVDRSVLLQVEPIARPADDTLNKKLVIIIKSNHIT